MHHNWQDNEIRELLRVRAHERFRGLVTGTVKDAVVFSAITRMLAQRGVRRSRDQVITKLKGLRRQYRHYRALGRDGGARVLWPFYEEAARAFGEHEEDAGMASPVSIQVEVEGGAPDEHEHEQVVVGAGGLWHEDRNMEQESGARRSGRKRRKTRKIQELEPEVEAELGHVHEHEDEEEDYGTTLEPPQSTTYSAPVKKRKATVMSQVSALISATVSQLRDMDAAVQAQEDARLQRLLQHERELQAQLVHDMLQLHRTISAENHQRHLELVDRVMSRVQSQSGPQSGPQSSSGPS